MSFHLQHCEHHDAFYLTDECPVCSGLVEQADTRKQFEQFLQDMFPEEGVTIKP